MTIETARIPMRSKMMRDEVESWHKVICAGCSAADSDTHTHGERVT